MKYTLLGGAFLALLLLALTACSGTSASLPKAPASTPGGSTTSGPTVYMLATQLVRSAPTEQVIAIQQGKPLWTYTLPAAGSVLILQGDSLFVGAGNSVLALNATNGQKQWATTTPGPHIAAIQPQGNSLFVATGLGGNAGQQALVVLNASDGSQRWRLSTPLGLAGWLIDGQLLYAVETGFPAQLVAADLTSGAIEWQKPLQSGVISGMVTAFLPADAASEVLVSQQSIALISNTGAVLWLHQNTHNLGVLVQSGAIYSFYVDKSTAFDGGQSVGLRALKSSDGSVLWDQKLANDDAAYLSFQSALTIGAIAQNAYLLDGANFDKAEAWNLSGQPLWTATGSDTLTILALGSQAVYVASAHGGITALDSATGKQIWLTSSLADVASLRVAGSGIFGVNSQNTTLYVINPSTGQPTWNFKVYQLHAFAVAD